jgi:hypothetical protein
MPIPVSKLFWGQFGTGPTLVLAPESALRVLPSRALSSAPSVCSVSARVMSRNYGKKKDRKKGLIFAALSDMLHNGAVIGEASELCEEAEKFRG